MAGLRIALRRAPGSKVKAVPALNDITTGRDMQKHPLHGQPLLRS
jgi:hypothetical protein